MAGKQLSLAERRSRIEAAREAFEGLDEVLATASGPELTQVLGLVDEVGARAAAARVQVTVEAVRRGECSGSEVHGWLCEHAPSMRQGGAGAVVAITREVTAADTRLERREPDPDTPAGIVWSAVSSGALAPATAVAVVREVDRLTPLLQPVAVPTVASALVGLARDFGPTMMRRLRPRLLAEHGVQGSLDDVHERLARAARLSSPRVESGDLTEYQLWMTPEQAATLEAAIGPLSAPRPDADTGQRDLRPAGQRRVEALTQVCRRSSDLEAESVGDPSTSGAVLHVSVDLAELESRTGAGEVLGSTADGTVIAPEVLRRLACDAALVPYVLGTEGEVLDVGRVMRLFTRAQRRLLRKRDRGCTYPGCTAPADWARAHHVRHWADGGTTDVRNAALLCQRHHTLVHRRRLWATVRERPDERGRFVVWDLTEGSYDHHLAIVRAAQPPVPPATRLLDALLGPMPPEPDGLRPEEWDEGRGWDDRGSAGRWDEDRDGDREPPGWWDEEPRPTTFTAA